MTDKLVNNIRKITTLRISWDSWDGIQVIWNILAKWIAITWNNINTIPDYPAEIRAPIGTIEWVSSFTISYWEWEIIPPSKEIDVIIIMNPASLKINLKYLNKWWLLIINSGAFNEESLEKVWFNSNPFIDWTFDNFEVLAIDIKKELSEILKNIETLEVQKLKSKNFYLLWLIIWLLKIESDEVKKFIDKKFENNLIIKEVNNLALEAWINYSKNIQLKTQLNIAKIEKWIWKYKMLNWNEAMAYSLIASAKSLNKKLYFSWYPITPANNIMHTLMKYKQDDVIVFQAEDEIAAIGWAIWASYAWAIWVTATSWPWFSLKSEAINLAVMTELPLIIIDVQRWWPSTWLPTKTEQSDLLQAIYGRHWESPIVVMAEKDQKDGFECVAEVVKIAIKYMTPVVILSDSYIAHSSSIMKLLDDENIINHTINDLPESENYSPYLRDGLTLARHWASPWEAWYEHTIWWLEKDSGTWKISYNPENHELMTKLRHEKIEWIKREISKTEVNWDDRWDILIIGRWSTYNSITYAVNELRENWINISSVHLRFLNPLPGDLFDIMKNFKKILVVEMNSWQLKTVLSSKYLLQIIWLNKVRWEVIFPDEIIKKIKELL